MKHFSSYWESSVLLRSYDYLIIGAGLVGKQIAIRIKEKFPQARTAILDRSPFSYGASTRNAGFACFGSVTELLDDLSHSDRQTVAEVTQQRYRGIQLMLEEFGEQAIQFRKTGGYEIFQTQQEFAEAENHLSFLNQFLSENAGIPQAFQICDLAPTGMKCHRFGFLNPHEGMINTGFLNEVIADKMLKAGVIPLFGLNAKSLEKTDSGYSVVTDEGLVLKTSQLVVANNAFASQLLPELDVKPARGQIILTNPLTQVPFDGVFHADKGYIYFRNLNGRVLIGGGRNQFLDQEETYDFEGTSNVREYLVNYLKKVVLPQTPFETEAHWSGIMAMGSVKKPIVKKVDDHLVVCVRMSGMGVALSSLLSQQVADFYPN